MPSFGRPAKPNNRSQHNLVESAGPAVAASGVPISTSGAVGAQPGPGQPQGPPSALGPSSNNESFVQDLTSAGQQPLHFYTSASGVPSPNPNQQTQYQQLHPLKTDTVGSEVKVRKAAHEFIDAVARSQSQKYHQVATPIQPNPSYGASYEDLPKALQRATQLQPVAYQQPQQQPQQGAPVEPRRSTRRLIKNILAGAPALGKGESNRADHSHHNSQSQNFYDNTAGLARRPSKRISNPPTLRSGPSQVSLDQQSIDWHSQGIHTQPSPLQSNPHEFQQPTLRRVPTNQDTSPYSDIDDSSFHHHQQGQVHIQTQLAPDQQQLGQVTFDPATRQYQFIAHSPPGQIQPEGNLPAYSGHLGAGQHQNPETISQLSHDSPGADGEKQASSNVQSATGSPAIRYSTHAQDFSSRASPLQSQQVPPPQQQQQAPLQQPPPRQQSMSPGGPPQTRRSQDTEKSLRGDIPPGPPPSYRHSQQPSNNMNPAASAQQGAGGQSSNFRQSTIQDRQQQFDGTGEQGRNSPQPSEDSDKAFKDLLTKYKNVKRLYFDGKTQIEQLNGQVEQLQNAVANQRISQSRTALDDNEYTTRFNRLNGAINNLSFNIRKDWVSLPTWLDKYVSADALKTGKQEMTAVGRAVITRWIVDEIFHSYFHPGLDPELSRQLKVIEQNIRRFCYTMNSQEEYDALTSKIVSWRMTTLEGLQHILQSSESANQRQEFTRRATADLTACLFQHLTDPPPAGVDGSASMIVELAVGIASNLPMESRDVAIIYPLPQDQIQPNFMEVEKSPLPVIETRPPDSDGDAESKAEDNGKESGGEKSGSSKERSKSRAGMSASSTLSSLLSSAPSALVPGSSSRKGSVASVSLSQQSSATGRKQSIAPSITNSTTNLALPPRDSNKVRFAGFLAVEVRGRQVLVKAPVWTLG